ncbi:MAG TPA: alkaline phosphatase family protein [Actinophytocola sp.]|uniref:alkaline phosphatase family protein n=1 Tax=Actinophytocola sp. TaxID=1872138 RepID=UPI002DB79E36|nr:alkaline phosphatase family protein [Actinophytocola sp.]HEU5469382.1 alkaline phosphatase family protein [Actinophytocola sp.]
MGTTPRVIAVITEGATPELLDRWVPEGRLPNFARLFAEGVRGTLDAEGVPYEPPGLVSLLTGHGPGDHGIFSYWSCHDPEYRPQVENGDRRRNPLMWHLPDLAGLKFGSVGLFGTHPVQPLDGWVVSYPMQLSLHACYPRGLQKELTQHGIAPTHDTAIWWHGQAKQDFVPDVLEADRRRGAAAMLLYDKGADAILVNLTSIDRLSHIFWQELEPGGVGTEDSAVFAAYRLADEIIGKLLDRADENTAVLAFSEIGFGPLRAYCAVNDDLAAAGLQARGDDGAVDWAASTAFEAVQGTHGVNINVRGRYKHGLVPEEDYERVRAEVAEGLAAVVNPRTGAPMFAAVSPREEIYRGDTVSAAPDLILEPADWRYLPLGDQTWAKKVYRNWQSAWHRRRSYWALAGAGRTAAGPDVARPVDVAATLVHLLGRDLPAGFTGTPLLP